MMSTEPETHTFKDALFVGLDPETMTEDPFFQKKLEIAIGANRHEKNWVTRSLTRAEFIASLIEFKEGDKDGLCITQGPLINGQRIAKNVIANHIIMLDCDTGESLESLERKVRDAGLFAVLWTTYSHMKRTTEVPEDRLVKLARDLRTPMPNAADEQPELCDLAREYLASKKYHKPILSSIHRVDKEHREGGIKFIVHHDPMPRARIMMFLKEPYVFATAKASQALAIQDWKELYAGVAELLGVDYDQSCVDPSRLMYTPRIAAGEGTPYERGHDIVVIAGKALDLDTVPRIKKGERSTSTHQSPLQTALGAAGISGHQHDDDAGEHKSFPSWLYKFLKQYGDEFDIVGFVNEYAYQDIKSNNGEKVELTCPNEDRHTEQKADDRAFMVRSGEGGFWAGCQHATCKTDSNEDRAWWLLELCKKYGVGYDELLMHCLTTDAEQAEQIEHAAAAKDDVKSAIAGLKSVGGRASHDQITQIIAGLSYLPDDARRIELLREVQEASKWGKGELERLLKEQDRLRDLEREAEREVLFQATPIPENPEDASIIWLHWQQPDQCRCAFARFQKLNLTSPTLYRRPEGGVVSVVNNTKAGVRIAELPNISDTIGTTLSDFGIRFVGATEEGEEVEKNAPAYVISYIRGKLHEMKLPELEKVTKVPVFSKEGILITEKGYNPHTLCFYDPGDEEFYAVPDVITDADVDAAVSIIDEPKRDFPFSDKFNEYDPEPIRDGKVDDEGFPLPNYKRGAGSRANYDAMVMQPFVRAMIAGPCPQYHIDKPAVGTGAGYLVDVAWIIAEGGERAEVKTLPHDDSMIKSMITSGLRGGKSILFLDNVQDQVNSPDLAAALTAGTWSDRLFRTHDEVIIPIKCTWVMAGNRIKFNRDMMRRNVPIYLNAEMANPASDRPVEFYKHKMLHEYVRQCRKDLVWAIHILVKNWVQKGRPMPTKSPVMQSFNDYSVVIGGILETAGIEGFLSNRPAYMEARNEDESAGTGLIRRIWKKHEDNARTIKEWLEACAPDGSSGIAAFAGGNKDFEIDQTLGLDMITSQKYNGMLQQLSGYVRDNCLGGTYQVDDEGGKVIVEAKQNRNKVWEYTLKRL